LTILPRATARIVVLDAVEGVAAAAPVEQATAASAAPARRMRVYTTRICSQL
jgi:hypothetical protein